MIRIPNNIQKSLLSIARTSIQHYLEHGSFFSTPSLETHPAAQFSDHYGVFITLKKSGQLRGCIGCVESNHPILHTVIVYSVYAAIRDKRFKLVTLDELCDITIEITALSPTKSITSYHDIIIGKHGIVLENGSSQSLFLPQVPVEKNWTLETTLSHLSQKAGLSNDAWQSPNTQFKVFEGLKFSENSAV